MDVNRPTALRSQPKFIAMTRWHHIKRSIMKTWRIIGFVAAIGSQMVSGGPHEPFTAETVTGVVDYAVWRSSFNLNRVYATQKGEQQDESIDKVPEHWIMILKETKGLNDVQRIYVSWAYSRLPIDGAWRYFTRSLQSTHLYLRISAPKNWPVKIGSTVKVGKLRYTGGDFEGCYSVESVEIDGKPVELPKLQIQPSWKTFEQAGAGQPATRRESKPEGKDKPQSESKPAPR